MNTITFEASDAFKPVADAWHGLRELEGRTDLHEDDVALAIVPKKWRRYVVTPDGAVDRRAYTF
jgi:hypothetical protein